MALTRKRESPPPTQDPARELAYQIAQDLYDLRTQQGLSQTEVAHRIGSKQPRISLMESAAGPLPNLSGLLRIAEALNARLVVRLEMNPEETDLP